MKLNLIKKKIKLLADRAKQIKTNAKINEDPKDLLIRQLQEEINMLKQNIRSGGVVEMSEDISKAGKLQKFCRIKV